MMLAALAMLKGARNDSALCIVFVHHTFEVGPCLRYIYYKRLEVTVTCVLVRHTCVM